MSDRFAHEAEAFVANIFDHHKIEWEYEPNTLILSEDEDGTVRKAFTPDFYLPEYDIYVEVTVMRKPSKKRKKIDMAVKAFPGINIILLCREDLKVLSETYKFTPEPCFD